MLVQFLGITVGSESPRAQTLGSRLFIVALVILLSYQGLLLPKIDNHPSPSTL